MSRKPLTHIEWRCATSGVSIIVPLPPPQPKPNASPKPLYQQAETETKGETAWQVGWVRNKMWVIRDNDPPIEWSKLPDINEGVDWKTYFYELEHNVQPVPQPPAYPPPKCKCDTCVKNPMHMSEQ